MDSPEFIFTPTSAEAGRVTGNLLPRSVVRPGDFELLDGEWRFELDNADRGLREKWYLGHNYTGTAIWPSTIEEHMARGAEAAAAETQPGLPAVGDEGTVIGWYERDFAVPPAWQGDPDEVVQVTFGACGYATRVWLNGHLLRTIEGEEEHHGEYTSFSYELQAEYLQSTNRLTVRTEDTLDEEITRGKQESRVYKRGGIWYQTISGPVRSVWIEPVLCNRLRSRLGVISSIEDRLVEFVITTRITNPGRYTVRLVVTPRGESKPIADSHFDLNLEAGETRQRLVLELPGAKLWSPEEPNLYLLTAQMVGPSGAASQIQARFGLRRIEARGRRIYLNGRATYLDGILYQPGTSSFEQIKRHMEAMQALGCNLVRVHITGIDARIYDLADEMGLLLWVEVPSPHTSSQRSRDNHWAELQRMLVIIGSHPSIVICSLYNEDWGVQDIAYNELTRNYVTRTWAHMRLNYPQMLVVDNDGWHHVSGEGRLESHLLTAHIYRPDLDSWREHLDGLVNGENEGVAPEPLVVGDPFFYRGQVPLVVSEWGGFGFAAYGGPSESESRAQLIKAFKEELRKRPIAGDVYTQATSIEQEVNGIIDPVTGHLLVPEGLLGSEGSQDGE